MQNERSKVMVNILKRDKQVVAISALVEDASIRSVEGMLNAPRDTIKRLGVRVGAPPVSTLVEAVRTAVVREFTEANRDRMERGDE